MLRANGYVSHRFLLSVIALSGAFVVAGAAAQGIPKEGRFDYTACWSGNSNLINFSTTHSAFSFEMTGTVRSNPPGGLFDKSTFRCVGTNTSFAGKATGINACEGVDPDGDKRLSYFSTTGDRIVREQVAGTGKWDGAIVTTEKIEPLGPFPTVKQGMFQNCNRQTGTYKLK